MRGSESGVSEDIYNGRAVQRSLAFDIRLLRFDPICIRWRIASKQ